MVWHWKLERGWPGWALQHRKYQRDNKWPWRQSILLPCKHNEWKNRVFPYKTQWIKPTQVPIFDLVFSKAYHWRCEHVHFSGVGLGARPFQRAGGWIQEHLYQHLQRSGEWPKQQHFSPDSLHHAQARVLLALGVHCQWHPAHSEQELCHLLQGGNACYCSWKWGQEAPTRLELRSQDSSLPWFTQFLEMWPAKLHELLVLTIRQQSGLHRIRVDGPRYQTQLLWRDL